MVAVAKEKRSGFGERLRALRERAGHTQVEMAEMLGIARNTYVRWERGDAEPTFSALCDIAAVLKVELREFQSGE